MSTIAPNFSVDAQTALRPVTIDDAERLFAVVDANRMQLRQWLPWLDRNKSVEDTRAFIDGLLERRKAGRGSVWLIEEASVLCGVVGFNWIEPVNRVCEIGYWLAAGQQRRGIMTRCVARLVRHAFEDLNINRITIPVAVENQRSRAIPEQLGFRAEGVLRQAEWLYDHFVDHVMYAMVRSEWTGAPVL
jgi:ribosomal-protein-serine acetyltransferase